MESLSIALITVMFRFISALGVSQRIGFQPESFSGALSFLSVIVITTLVVAVAGRVSEPLKKALVKAININRDKRQLLTVINGSHKEGVFVCFLVDVDVFSVNGIVGNSRNHAVAGYREPSLAVSNSKTTLITVVMNVFTALKKNKLGFSCF